MSQDLSFGIDLSPAHAIATIKGLTAKMREEATKQLSDTEIAEKAKVEAAKRANRQKIQEAAKGFKTEIDLANETAAAKKKADADAARAKTKADREAARSARQLNREVNDLLRSTARDETRAAADVERARKQAAASATKAEKDAYAEAVRGAKEAARIEKLMAQETEKATGKTDSLMSSLMGLSGAMIGINSIGQMFTSVTDHFDKIRTDAFHAAEDVLRMRESIRELAALRGQMGQTGETTGHVLSMAAETLQRPEEVQQMESAGLGIGELAIGKNISKEEFEKALISAGKMQTLEGGPAKGYGAMVGQLALSAKGPITSADLEGKMQRMFEIQQPGGFENFGQAAEQYAKVQPLVLSGVLSEEQAMGLLSTMSTASPGEAATMTEQFVRATMAGRMRERGMKTPEGVESQKSAEYMKSIGADKLINPVEIGKRIAADLKAQEARAQKEGRQWDAYGYLGTHGFNNQQDLQTVLLMAGMENAEKVTKIREAETKPIQQGVISERFEDRRKKDLMLQGRAGQISEQLATYKQGMEEEPLIAAQRAAFARLKSQRKISGSFEEWQSTGATQAAIQDLNPLALNYHSQVNKEAMRALELERRRVGAAKPSLSDQPGAQGYMRQFAKNVRAAGGDVTAGVADDLRKTAEDLRAAAAEQRAAAKELRDARTAKPPALAPPQIAGRM